MAEPGVIEVHIIGEDATARRARINRLCDRLKEIATLEENWDSYQARAIDKTTIDRAFRFLNDLDWPPKLTEVAPSTSGGVYITDATEDLMFEIRPNGDFSFEEEVD